MVGTIISTGEREKKKEKVRAKLSLKREFRKKNRTCGLKLPREPNRSTRLLQLTGRGQYDGILISLLMLSFVF